MNNIDSLPEWVERVPNHDMKPVVMMGLMRTNEPLTQLQLGNAIDQLQLGIIDFDRKSAQQYCDKSLEPAGFTRQAEASFMKLGVREQSARGDELTEEGVRLGVPIIGHVAAWSLDRPHLKLQTVLGTTTPSRTAEGVSQVKLRYTIYKHLLEHGEAAVTDFQDVTRRKSQSATIAEMESEGLVVVERSHSNNGRTFQITQPNYEPGERKKAFEKLLPEKQLLFRALKVAVVIRDIWSLEDFMRVAEAIDDDTQKIQNLQMLVLRLLTPSFEHRHRYIKNVSGPLHQNGEKYSTVRINAKYRDDIETLVQVISDCLAGSSDVLNVGREKAEQIADDPLMVAELIAKSRKDSANVIRDPQFDEHIAEIIADGLSPVSIKEIHTKYEAKFQRKIGLMTLSKKIVELTRSGIVEIHARPRNVGRTHSAPLFSIAI